VFLDWMLHLRMCLGSLFVAGVRMPCVMKLEKNHSIIENRDNQSCIGKHWGSLRRVRGEAVLTGVGYEVTKNK